MAPASAPRPKNTLFCPRCGHESAADGDWRVTAPAADDALRCPACAAVVATASPTV